MSHFFSFQMISDLCNDPEGFIVTQFSSNLSRTAVKYYMKCASQQPPVVDNPLLDAEQNMTDRIHHIQSFIHLIDTALKSLESNPKVGLDFGLGLGLGFRSRHEFGIGFGSGL